MRKNRREIAALFTAFVVILAAGVSSTTQMPVVCAEEEHGNEADDLTAQEGNDQATDQDETGNEGQGGSENTTGSDVQDGANNATGTGTGNDTGTTGSGTSGAGCTENSTGTETDDSAASGNHGTSVGTGTNDDETDGDTDTADVPDDTSDEIEEGEMLLMNGIATFLLGNSRDVEEVSVTFGDIVGLNKDIETYTNNCPVKATLSGDITDANEPIQVGAGTELTLDLNGHSISASSTAVSVTGGGSLTIINSGTLSSKTGNTIEVTVGTLVVESGKISAESRSSGNDYVGAISVESGGKAEINGGTVSGKGYAVAVRGGTVDINGGTLEAESSAESADVHTIQVNSGSLTVSDGYIIARGGTGSGSLCIQSGSAEITGGSFETTVTGDYGYACYVVGSAGITIKGGNFELSAPGGKSLYIDTSGAVSVSGGIYNNSIGIKTGVDGNNAGIGKWADSFYGKLKGGILSDNTFCYEKGGIVYTNPSVTVKSGTWDGKCMEDRELEAGIYSFGSDGWRVHADSTVYCEGDFYAPSNATYFFTKK